MVTFYHALTKIHIQKQSPVQKEKGRAVVKWLAEGAPALPDTAELGVNPRTASVLANVPAAAVCHPQLCTTTTFYL